MGLTPASLLFWSSNTLGAFVPAFVSQPLFERMKVNFGIRPAKTGDVRLISSFIEPTEHGVKLSAQNDADEGQGKFLKLHRLAQHAAEDLGGLRVGQLAAGDLQFFSDELSWPLECQSNERSDVVRRNGLVWLVTADGVHEFPFQKADFHLVDVVRLHESDGPDHGGRQTQASNVFFDFPLALPVRNAGVALRSANRTVDKVFDTNFFAASATFLPCWTSRRAPTAQKS